MRRLAFVLLVACGHAPPPPPRAEIAVADVAAIKGHWVFTTEVDWTYFLSIEPDGRLHITADRGGQLGRCEQQGRLVPASAQHFHLAFDRDGCSHEAVKSDLDLVVASFTGDDLVIELAGERRHYKRVKPQ